ncbi:MAG: ABC transporter permease [Bryobacter sp.]|nr:ABC transporter permease [Bryobacter sp.]
MINKLVVENLKHRPVRTLLGMLAIALQVTMVLTIVGLSYGMLEESRRRTRGVGADIIVRPPGTSFISLSSAPMSEKLVPYFAGQPGVALATGVVVHPLVFPESIIGIDLAQFNKMSGGFRFLQGGAFSAPNDIVVDDYYARQRKLDVGSTLTLLNQPWRVCGIVESGKLGRVFLPLPVLQGLTSNTGKLSQIYLEVAPRTDVATVVRTLRDLPELKGYAIYSTEELVSLISVQNIPGLKPFINVIIGLSLIIGFLVVFLSMYTAVLERTREIGILKALGASPATVMGILVRETTAIALAGAVIGIGFSYGTRWLIFTFVPASLQQMIVYEWWPIVVALALAAGLAGALYPGLKAAKQDAIEALAYE